MRLKIISPTKVLCDTEIVRAVFPGSLGTFEVLKSHAPLLSALTAGEIRYDTAGGETKSLAISSGSIKVLDDFLEACVESRE